MTITPILLLPTLALLLGLASPASSLASIRPPGAVANSNSNSNSDLGWTTTLPASMQPPLPQSSPKSISLQSNTLHYDIPIYGHFGGPSAVPLSIDLHPDPSNATLPLPDLLYLFGACNWQVINNTNRPQLDIPFLAWQFGLFACSVPDTSPLVAYFSLRYVSSSPPVSGRTVYGYLSSVLRGLSAWAFQRGGLPEGNMWISERGERPFTRDVFIIRMAGNPAVNGVSR